MASRSQNHNCLFYGMRTRCIQLLENLLKIMVLAANVLFSRRLIERLSQTCHGCEIAIAKILFYTASFSCSFSQCSDTRVKTCLKIGIKSNARQRSLLLFSALQASSRPTGTSFVLPTPFCLKGSRGSGTWQNSVGVLRHGMMLGKYTRPRMRWSRIDWIFGCQEKRYMVLTKPRSLVSADAKMMSHECCNGCVCV